MRLRLKSAFLIAVLALAAAPLALAQDPLPKIDSWRHQRPPGSEVVEPKVTEPKAPAARERKSAAPKTEAAPKVAAPAPALVPSAPPPPQPAFAPPPQALPTELLLGDALASLTPQRPGVSDVYFLAFAGWGDQNVFRNEAERVRELFDERFGTKGRSLILVNNPDTMARYPAATMTNLKLALVGLGQRMDPKKDVLVLFITSHGLQNRGVAMHMNGKEIGMLTPRLLAEALEQAGIKKRVVIISACFSGQFLTALESEESLVIAAAAPNRMSFGCTATAEWTWFSQSYFVDALPKIGKLVPAFVRAKELVAQKETAEKVVPSEPQISVGRSIERLLRSLGY